MGSKWPERVQCLCMRRPSTKGGFGKQAIGSLGGGEVVLGPQTLWNEEA